MTESRPRVVYCHCAQAQVVPPLVKEAVLRGLCDSAADFVAIPDLCELAARRDPVLADLAGAGEVKIAACYPRAVRWLFSMAGARLAAERTEVLNMRVETAEVILEGLTRAPLRPNLAPAPNGPGAKGSSSAQASAPTASVGSA